MVSIRHLGTEEGYKIYTRLQKYLEEHGVQIEFMTSVEDLLIENGTVKGVITEKGEVYEAPEVVSGVGRDGSIRHAVLGLMWNFSPIL